MPRIQLSSIYVDNQDRALAFYTDVLGFVMRTHVPVGTASWTTVASAEDPEGPELVLQAVQHKAVQPYRRALYRDRIPMTAFAVDSVDDEYERLRELGVRFVQKPTTTGPVTTAVLDDTCGNLVQIVSPASPEPDED